MNELIIDSSILIDCLRGRSDAVAFLAAGSVAENAHTHLVVAAELLTGARDKRELVVIDSFIQSLNLIVPTHADCLQALDWYRQLRLSHGVDWPDCQIAATASRMGRAVSTLNVKHFRAFPGVQIFRPY